MSGGHIGEGQAHAESVIGVGDFGVGFEDTVVAEDTDEDGSALGEGIERVNVTAAESQFGGARGETCAGAGSQLGDFGGSDQGAAQDGAAFGWGRFF